MNHLPVDAKLLGDGLGADSHGHDIVSSPHAPSDAIIGSDPILLFNGELTRSGVDLITSKDDHEPDARDYLRSEKRAAHSSPDSAHLTGNFVNARTGHVEYAQARGAPDAIKVIGHIRAAIGSGTLTRAGGIAVPAKGGDPVCQGDIIGTAADGRVGICFIDGTGFELSGGARMVLDEFVCDANGTSHSPLIGVTRGTFAFIVGQLAETGCLRIDTPVGSIRGRARTGGIGMLSLTALIFSLMKEVEAAEFSSQRPLLDSLDDDKINPKDLQLNGTIELFMRDGRHYTLDDPSQTIVISGGSISVVTNSATQMAQLQRFQQEALAAYALGTGPTSTGRGGSSTSPSLLLSPQGLQPINFNEPVPQNLRSATTQSAFVSPTILLEAPAPAPSKSPLLTLAVITPMVGNSSVNTAHTLNASGASTGFAINGTTDGVENGQTVTVTIVNGSGVAVQTFTTTVANNAWSVNVGPTNARALSDGNYTVTADVSNALGTATARASQNVTVDQTPPAPPGAVLTTDSGSSNSDHITNVAALSLSEIEPGAPVEYSIDGGSTWTASFAPVEGPNTVLVRQTDAAGNVSTASSFSFTLDTALPAATLAITAIATDTGTSNDFITSDTTLIVSGSNGALAPGEKIQVSSDGGASWHDVTQTGTSWSYNDTANPHGLSFTYTARIVDAAGNIGTTTSQAITIDTALPAATLAITAIATDTGTSNDFITSDTTLIVSGSNGALAPGEKIQVSSDGGASWHDVTQTGTSWSYNDTANPHGLSFTYTARIVDAAGNIGTTTSQAITIDTALPAATLAITAIATDTGTSNDFITSDTTLIVSGSNGALAPGEKIQVSSDGGASWHDVTQTGTSWSYNDTANPHGLSFTYTARIVDAAGNIGTTTSQAITIDTALPAATLAITAIATDTGTSNDFITSDTTLIVSGSNGALAPGEKIQVSSDGGASWHDVTQTGTSWSYNDTANPHGLSFTYTARIVDAAGNIGTTTSQAITIDTALPAATLAITAIATDTGTSNDFITSDTTLIVSGSNGALAPGEKIQVSSDGGASWHDVTQTGTSWSYNDTANPHGLSFTYTARIVDAAGNIGTTTSQAITIDTALPAATLAITAIATDTGTSNDFITSDTTLIVSGSNGALAPGEKIQVSSDGGASWHDVTQTGTSWSYNDTANPHGLSFTYTARIVDAAGNIGTTTSQAITIDTALPAATLAITAIATDTGTSNDFITSDTTLIVSGSNGALAPGEKIQVSSDGGASWHDVTQTGTSWSYNDTANPHGLSFTYTARIVDAAGNIGTTTSQAITIDTALPAATLAITAIATDTGTSNDFITSDTTLIVSGSNGALAPGEKIQVSSDGGASWHDVTQTGTSWSYNDTANPHGLSFTYTARIVDAAGNIGTTTSQAITIDTALPAATLAITAIATDTGTSNDFITSDTTLIVSGSNGALAPGEKIQVSSDGGASWHDVTQTGTSWSYNDTANPHGLSFTYTARIVDAAGNIGTTTSQAITIDTALPAATLAITAIATDTGTSNDFITSDTTLIVSGSNGALAPGEKIQVSSDGGASWHDVTQTGTSWSYNDTANPHGLSFTYTARIVDAAGNIGTTTSQAITIDISDPNNFDSLATGTTVVTIGSVVHGTPGNDSIAGGGNDGQTVYGGAGNDTINGTGEIDLIYGGSSDDTIKGNNGGDTIYGGSGNDTINGNNEDDTIVGGFGADALTGGAGNDKFKYLSVADSRSGQFDTITDFTSSSDKIDLTAFGSTTFIHFSALTSTSTPVAGNTVAWFYDGTQVIVYANPTNLPLTIGDSGLLEIHLTGISSIGLTDLINVTAGPAGVADEPINFGLAAALADDGAVVTMTVADVPSAWTVNGGTLLNDGETWTAQTNDPSSLTITSAAGFVGAMVFNVTEAWTQADGSLATIMVRDNVEVYPVGSPILALTGDDFLTASSGSDLLTLSQPIGHDTIYSFDAAHDQLDLIGYANFANFADIGAHLADDVNGDAVVTLGDGQSIKLHGVHAVALTENNFVFDQTLTVDNAATMTIGDGALLPLSGAIVNAGTIALNSTGDETDLRLIEQGVTLEGGGRILLSDSDANIISGTSSGVTLNNVDNTISGAGQLGNGKLTLTNAGTINATGSHTLTIDTGSNLVTNSGVLEASGSGGMMVASGIVNSGLPWANGATLTGQGAVSGNGTATIDGFGTLDFEASASADVVFGSGTGGALKLGDSFHFNGTISGFGGADVIELANVAATNVSISYEENPAGTGGTLAISNGAQTLELALLGQYSAENFNSVSDQLHGTFITYVPHDLML